jgi:hypothetical protein
LLHSFTLLTLGPQLLELLVGGSELLDQLLVLCRQLCLDAGCLCLHRHCLAAKPAPCHLGKWRAAAAAVVGHGDCLLLCCAELSPELACFLLSLSSRSQSSTEVLLALLQLLHQHSHMQLLCPLLLTCSAAAVM